MYDVTYSLPKPEELTSVIVMQRWMQSGEMYESRRWLSWELIMQTQDMTEVLSYLWADMLKELDWRSRSDPEFIASRVLSGDIPSEPATPGDPQRQAWIDFRNAMDERG